MDQQHPITPPPELYQQWCRCGNVTEGLNQAAQWGADTELEACCEYLVRCAQWEPEDIEELRTARRPKPPSLKAQALALVEQHEDGWRPSPKDWDTIRRALEQLPNAVVTLTHLP